MTKWRVERGQPVSTAFSAAGWNRAQDAADIVLGDVLRNGAGSSVLLNGGASTVIVRNLYGTDLPIYSVVGVTGVANESAASAQLPQLLSASPILNVSAPASNTQCLILLEPIANNAYGRAVVSGAFAVRVTIRNNSHRFLQPVNDNTTTLRSASCGYIRLLAKSAFGQGDWKWAIGAF
jgi:hypothetical protein